MDLRRRATAEAVGTAMLLACVVGSGIMGERLCGGNLAIALLANTLATGAVLVALILTFGPISGAHLNPAVTVADAWQGGIAWRDVPAFVVAQALGAAAATALFRWLNPALPRIASEVVVPHHARWGAASRGDVT
jgi:glycerol uptake facilitator-like aquaporin